MELRLIAKALSLKSFHSRKADYWRLTYSCENCHRQRNSMLV